jgi:alpha-1,3-rhamnosyl/mannosyltransferase
VITTVSNFVKRQIADYFTVSPERILVAPDAVDPVFGPGRARAAGELARRLGVRGPYIVAIGGAPRRGLPVAIEAWRRANTKLGLAAGAGTTNRQATALVVVGEADLPSEDGLVPVGFLEDEAWATLLAGAQALCYPTRYEGFVLPALEAAASGTPVVCAPVASLPEVMGDAACWASDGSPEAIASALARLLTDPALHRERREAGLDRARGAASWQRTAEVLFRAYELAAR